MTIMSEVISANFRVKRMTKRSQECSFKRFKKNALGAVSRIQ